MMRRLSALLVLLLIAACSSSDYDDPRGRPPRGGDGERGGYGRPARVREAVPMLLDVVPDDSWWRDFAIAEPLNLSEDQFKSLDKIAAEQRDEIARLERDLPVAAKDLRAALDADPTSAAGITTAAQRVRSIRDSLFDRQAQMLAAERLVLSGQQWTKLVQELKQQRDDRMNRRGNGDYPGGNRGGGRGGYPRGGRGRPWP
jgi:Spy/CpxP family protein refolding chaperone